MTQKNVLCKPDLGATSNNDASTSEKAAQTEFSAMTGINLRKGMMLTMSDLQAAYLWENLLKQTKQCP